MLAETLTANTGTSECGAVAQPCLAATESSRPCQTVHIRHQLPEGLLHNRRLSTWKQQPMHPGDFHNWDTLLGLVTLVACAREVPWFLGVSMWGPPGPEHMGQSLPCSPA